MKTPWERAFARLGFVVLAILVSALWGCGVISSDDGSSNNKETEPPTAGVTFTLLAASGNQVNPDGTWPSCFLPVSGGNIDKMESWVMSRIKWTVEERSYSSSTGLCDGTETPGTVLALTIGVTNASQALAGWSNGGSSVALEAPSVRQDGGGPLADPPSATVLNFTGDATGETGKMARFIDDTAATRIMYRDFDDAPAACAAVDGVANCLLNQDTLSAIDPFP